MAEPKNKEEKPKAILRCSFCNKSQRDVQKLIAGPTVYICNECVDICVEIINEDRAERLVMEMDVPTRLIAAADSVTPGHERAKRVLAAAIGEHAVRAVGLSQSPALSAVFVAGPTGAGKSQIIEAMAVASGLPMVSIDASLLFADSPFKPKLDFSGFEKKPGIIVLHQLEAVAMRGSRKEDCRHVQQSLIALLDGASIQTEGRSRITRPEPVDLGKALFIAVGSYSDMPLSRTDGIGPEALTRYGYLPELLARFGTFITLHPLTERDIQELLVREGGLISDCQTRFAQYGRDVKFEPNAIEEIVRVGVRRKAGVRGVKAVMDRLGIALAAELPQEELRVNAEYIARNLD